MFVFIFLGLLATSLASPQGRIINGQIAEKRVHTYIVSIQIGTLHNCGGTILTKNKILTAAHCVGYDQDILNLFRVVAGAHDLGNLLGLGVQIRYIANAVIHPGYERFSDYAYNDLAIITLNEDLVFNSKVTPAQLPAPHESFVDTLCRIAGWGTTTVLNGQPVPVPSPILMEANVTNIALAECQLAWPNITLVNHETCFHDETGSGASGCAGDSGGPIMCGTNMDKLTAAVSYGEDSCGLTIPFVGPQVSEFLDFIYANL